MFKSLALLYPPIRRLYEDRNDLLAKVTKLEAERTRELGGSVSAEKQIAAEIDNNLSSDRFPIPKFWEQNFWEPTVQIALRDYCKPGDVVFDVGANAGALSMVMSRCVGPNGIVCAFEASPRIIDKTHHNLVSAGCSNTTLYFRAVYHTSHETVTLYPGTHLNDSIYNDYGAEGGSSYEVETLALDDFVHSTGLMPRLIKMDVEGAEFDALMGSPRILSEGKPVLILEQSPEDMRCFDTLTRAGYVGVDLGNYRRIEGVESFEDGVGIANVLFVHQDYVGNDPYFNASMPKEVLHLEPKLFLHEPDGSLYLRDRVELDAGRYVCKADFAADGVDNEIFAGIDSDRGVLVRYHGFTQLICGSYREWVFSLPQKTLVTPYIQFLRGADPSLNWGGAKLFRYQSFDDLAPSVIF